MLSCLLEIQLSLRINLVRYFWILVGISSIAEARNLIITLSANKRISILPQICQLFEQLKAQYEGILEAKIVSAFALEGKQLNKLIKDLEQKFKHKIEAKISIDPELIGGVKVEIGDEVFDASVRGKLEALAVAIKS